MAAQSKAASIARRKFVFASAKMACGVGLAGLALAFQARQAAALAPAALRPPGAGSESDFQGACIRCGLCVHACPYGILALAGAGQPIAAATPYFVARTGPCEMCEDLPCVRVCPTPALDHGLTDIDKARMGLAVLVDHETCLNFLGLRCDVCYRVCPLIDKAITLDVQHNERTRRHALFLPTVHSDKCTGCGKCEASCVLEVAAIKVLPLALAKGELGAHYRLGWEEQQKAGQSLLEEKNIIDLPDRMPAGVKLEGHFDPGGRVPAEAASGVDSLQAILPHPGTSSPTPHASESAPR